ncbi:hypothetical protein PVK62_08120 [Aliivibrio sp. S3MY1]|uniref:Uncharacterized protein n=2 Tax=Aliivibrio TaxID=511678 RepID=A0A5Q4ZYQ9_9GAMM|nr:MULTISPECIES: hypothetical protein [Aliivibrio]VVV07008.1 hypothetical protein AW0309160_04502 [Aliivibrio wodanis]MDD9175984.1 hypothetical protein [Aliivibrio sp. S3TY1]MDD9193101.1 hypothetical protein [Aliivibrio sp. S2TY2]MDD9195805.1 hypothetical protein [Aliivibrio sp. S3MY1]RYU63815.1 hypothetical protein ERW53_12305 [Aliivibrio finisterrensis]
MNNSHHENKPAKVFLWEWPVALPLLPLGAAPSWNLFYAWLVWIALLTILAFFNIRITNIFWRCISQLRGKKFYARNKNNR